MRFLSSPSALHFSLSLFICLLFAHSAFALVEDQYPLTEFPSESVDLLLVVGLVTETKARILYEALVDEWDGAEIEVVVAVGSGEGRASPVTTVTPRRYAQVVEVPGLQENTAYNVSFRTATRNEVMTFKTMVSPTTAARDSSVSLQQRLIVVSCDRYGDVPSDDDFVRGIAVREAGKYDVMVHLGDNIYSDQYAEGHMNDTFDEALEGYRTLYRRAWGRRQMSTLLRHGSHWMAPDDHEILRSLSPEMINKGESLGIIYGARRAAYEYQLQLLRDIPPMSEAQKPGCEKFNRAFHFGNTGYLFIDTRLHRSFVNEDESGYPLTGPEQFHEVAAILHDWQEDPLVKNIVGFTSMPIFRPTVYGAVFSNLMEGDKYPLHPDLQQNTFAVLEAFLQAGASKASTIIFSGDLHCFYEAEVCRTTPNKTRNCLNTIISSGITRGSEGLTSYKLCISFMVDFGPLSPQTLKDKKTGNVWTEREYVKAFPLNNYAILETSARGNITWTRTLRVPSPKEDFILLVWFRHGKVAVPITIALLLTLVVATLVGFYKLVKRGVRRLLGRGKITASKEGAEVDGVEGVEKTVSSVPYEEEMDGAGREKKMQ